MKKYLLALLLATSLGCESPADREVRLIKEHADSVFKAVRISQIADSLSKKITADVSFDTVGIESGPVKVLSATLVRREYSSYRNIALTYKNVSGKTIEGIRFKWYGIDAFGEPAKMGSMSSFAAGFGSGQTDETIRPGKSASGQWDILSDDAKKIVKAWPYEVAFSDGTKWESTRN